MRIESECLTHVPLISHYHRKGNGSSNAIPIHIIHTPYNIHHTPYTIHHTPYNIQHTPRHCTDSPRYKWETTAQGYRDLIIPMGADRMDTYLLIER